MCGIAGIMMSNGQSPDPVILSRLRKSLAHRGPDGSNCHIQDATGLIHTRLAIIDLETGDQPLFGMNNCVLIANGEIYNNPELRSGELSGLSFKTRSDCEPILHLYDRYGIDCPSKLRGMYAFALYDPQQMSLILSRDPFGIKPLYYIETENFFAFSSEPQALIASGLAKAELEPGQISELLQLQFTTGKNTIFHNIFRLLPGETLLIKAGHIAESRKTAALPPGQTIEIEEISALRQLDKIMSNSVMVHQRSDVPYGLFLSSGIDSASILSVMSQLNESPVIAYTASFPGTELADEFPQAQIVARAAGAHHINIEVTESDFWQHLPQIAAALDDPVADYAIIPTWLLARAAAKDVKVVLCGEGGDEIFAGYGRYRRQIRPWWLGGRECYRTAPFPSSCNFKNWRAGIVTAEKTAAMPGRSPLQIAQAADCEHFLPHDLLIKLDRCLMAHGLEGRTPFLDPQIAAFGFLLPQHLKLRQNLGKYLLRCWLQSKMPDAIPFARKKGFTVPVGEWIRRSGKRLGKQMAANPAITALCKPEMIHNIFNSDKKHDQEAAWRLLFYALWHRRHVIGLQPEGDAFHCLHVL